MLSAVLLGVVDLFSEVADQRFCHLNRQAKKARLAQRLFRRGLRIDVAELQHQRLMTVQRSDVPAGDRIEGKTGKFIHFKPDFEA